MKPKGADNKMLSKEEIVRNQKKIISALESTKRNGIGNLINWLETSNFFTSPASTRFHGNYGGGISIAFI